MRPDNLTPLDTVYSTATLDGVSAADTGFASDLPDAAYARMDEMDGAFLTGMRAEDRWLMRYTGATESEVWG